ncbi:putative pyruvate dehydrogenase [Xylaria sp. FL1042]|nr:putative pyruvate dehydrogenase [Xylaria sp. FL1042]
MSSKVDGAVVIVGRTNACATGRAIGIQGRYLMIRSSSQFNSTSSYREASSNQKVLPLFNDPPTEILLFDQGPNEEEVTRILSQEAYHFKVETIPGVNRYDGTRVASNDPTRDRFIHGRFPAPRRRKSEWMTWGIFDGHGGWETADVLEKHILAFFRKRFAETIVKTATEDRVRTIMRKAFIELDHSIIEGSDIVAQSDRPTQDKVKALAISNSGSSALLSIYVPETRDLHVAWTGNSRAVLVTTEVSSKGYSLLSLSKDHTYSNLSKSEQLFLSRAQKGLIQDGRLLGLKTTRSFGDGYLKRSKSLQEHLANKFALKQPSSQIINPPYITAEPDVSTHKIDPTRPSFLIMASDGEERVPDYPRFYFDQGAELMSDSSMKERRTIKDDNAAVHLVRNALGGNHHEMIASVLAVNKGSSRGIRDNITVQVIFFNTPHL